MKLLDVINTKIFNLDTKELFPYICVKEVPEKRVRALVNILKKIAKSPKLDISKLSVEIFYDYDSEFITVRDDEADKEVLNLQKISGKWDNSFYDVNAKKFYRAKNNKEFMKILDL